MYHAHRIASEPDDRERSDLANFLRIERETRDGEARPISLKEWSEAIDNVDGVRLCVGDASVRNPLTKENVIIPNRGGDAEIFREDCNRWLRVLWWSPHGSIHFTAPESSDDPLLVTARALAGQLEARIVGDEGEI
ncbi:hypothetical protein [Novosphingobium sp. PY1]|jgi:hypothetical protein|uniref:hypothetical protein n=1 Tax=Novosphingobium sp. PY1 TaxID=1882221 RepID=UPI001F5D66C1|nr:hypothetical protein [Novosphingobium sp. PY1]